MKAWEKNFILNNLKSRQEGNKCKSIRKDNCKNSKCKGLKFKLSKESKDKENNKQEWSISSDNRCLINLPDKTNWSKWFNKNAGWNKSSINGKFKDSGNKNLMLLEPKKINNNKSSKKFHKSKNGSSKLFSAKNKSF